MKTKITILIAISLLLFTSSSLLINAQITGGSGDGFIQGNLVEVGIDGDCGIMGGTDAPPPGYHQTEGSLGFVANPAMDAWASQCGDYFLPGSPAFSWGISFNGTDYINDGRDGLCDIQGANTSNTQPGDNNGLGQNCWEASQDGLDITQITTVGEDDLFFVQTIYLCNTTATDMNDVYYITNFDPDNDEPQCGDFSTTNTNVSQGPGTPAEVTAVGVCNGCFLSLNSGGATNAVVGHGGGAFSGTPADDFYNQTTGSVDFTPGATTTSDIGIGIAYYYPVIAAGTCVSFPIIYELADGITPTPPAVIYFTAEDADPATPGLQFCSGQATDPPTLEGFTADEIAGGVFQFCNNNDPGDGASIDATTGVLSGGVAGNTYCVEFVYDANADGVIDLCTDKTASTTLQFETCCDDPMISITASAPSACEGEAAINLTVNEDVAGTGAINSYTWTGGGGNLSSTTVANPTFSTASVGTFNLTVDVTTDDGCSASASITITIYGVPAAPTPDPAANFDVCEGFDVSAGLTADCATCPDTVNPDCTETVVLTDNGGADGPFGGTGNSNYHSYAGTCTGGTIEGDAATSTLIVDVTNYDPNANGDGGLAGDGCNDFCGGPPPTSGGESFWVTVYVDGNFIYDDNYDAAGNYPGPFASGVGQSLPITLTQADYTFSQSSQVDVYVYPNCFAGCGALTGGVQYQDEWDADVTTSFTATFNGTAAAGGAANVTWYNAATGGTIQDTGNPFVPTGTNAEEGAFDVNTPGTYTYYATCECNGCESTATPFTFTVWPEVTATNSYPDAPAECRIELTLSDPSYSVDWTANDDVQGTLSGDETSTAMTATPTGYIWDAFEAFGGTASLGDVTFTISNPTAPATIDGSCQQFILGPIDYLCCIASSGQILDPGFAFGVAELCEGESISDVGGTLSITGQNAATVSLETTVYETGFILVDATTGTVVNWTAGTGPVDYSPAAGCYNVYAYNYNVFTGEAGADLVGQNIADIQAGLFTDPQPISGPGGGDNANCAALSDPGPNIYVYPDLQVTATTSDYNGYGVSCNIGTAFCDNPTEPYSCINDGFFELTITGGTGDDDYSCQFDAVDYTITVTFTDIFGNTSVVYSNIGGTPGGPGGTNGAPVLVDDGGFGLLAGIYTVEVTDPFVGCSTSTTVNITEPPVLTCSAVAADVSCPENTTHTDGIDPDGNVIFTFDGGVSNPLYNGYLVAFFEGTAATGYTQLPLPPGGPITLIGQAGAPIDYIGQFTEGLPEGDYMVQVLDGNGCACQANVVVERPEPLEITCGGNSQEGSLGNISPFWYNTHTITISGGTAPYEVDMEREGYVTWAIADNGDGTSTVSINYADNAEWCVSVLDANGCTVDATAFDCCNDDGIEMGDNPSIPDANGNILDIEGVVITGESGVNTNDGAIGIEVSGCEDADGPSYQWSGPNGYTSTDPAAMGIESGLYYVTVTCDGETTIGWYWVPLDRSGGRLKTGTDVKDVAIEVYPNPFTDYTNIDFTLNESMRIKVEVFSIDGKRMKLLFDGKAQGGMLHNLPIYQSDLAGAGTYTCIISTEKGDVFYKKFVLAK